MMNKTSDIYKNTIIKIILIPCHIVGFFPLLLVTANVHHSENYNEGHASEKPK
jgi:hypothetical protein